MITLLYGAKKIFWPRSSIAKLCNDLNIEIHNCLFQKHNKFFCVTSKL